MRGFRLAVVGSALILVVALAVGGQPDRSPPPWPFDYEPPVIVGGSTGTFADYVMFQGSVELSGAIVLDIGANSRLVTDPFFFSANTQAAVLPTFGARQSLEAGVEFDWWSLSADANATLVPWAFTSSGAWFELAPPEWVFGNSPIFRVEGSLGAGPQWTPVGWTFDAAGALDLRGGLTIPVGDGSFDLVAGTAVDAQARWPGGFDLVDWTASIEATTPIPWLSGENLHTTGRVRIVTFVLPAFGAIADFRVDLRSEHFRAYVMVGLGTIGFAYELGAEYSFVFGLWQ